MKIFARAYTIRHSGAWSAGSPLSRNRYWASGWCYIYSKNYRIVSNSWQSRFVKSYQTPEQIMSSRWAVKIYKVFPNK